MSNEHVTAKPQIGAPSMGVRPGPAHTLDNATMKAALERIMEIGHYPDATIARRALGLPVTENEANENRRNADKARNP